MPIWKLPASIEKREAGASLDVALKGIVQDGENYRESLIQAIRRYGDDRRVEALEACAALVESKMRLLEQDDTGAEAEAKIGRNALLASIVTAIRALK